MTDLVEQYIQTCAAAKAVPSAQLIFLIEQHYKLAVHEESYPAGTLTDEIELYRRIALDQQQKTRAERIIEFLEYIKQKVAGRVFNLPFDDLAKLNSKRADKIRLAAGNDLEKVYADDFVDVGGDLCDIPLKQYVEAFTSDLLAQSRFNKRVRTLGVAQQAGKSLHMLFGAYFKVQHGILVKDDFDQQMQELSQQMAQYETQVIDFIKSQLGGHAVEIRHFRQVFAAYGMFRRKNVQSGVSSLANSVQKAFLQIAYAPKAQAVDSLLEELQNCQNDVQVAFQVVSGLFADSPAFKQVDAHCKELVKLLQDQRLRLIQQAQARITEIITKYEPSPCLFFDSTMGRAFGCFPGAVSEIHRIIIAFERYGLKLERTPEQDKAKHVLQCYPAVLSLGSAANYYNLLHDAHPPFVIQVLGPQIERFEAEMRKCAQASVFAFDAQAVEQLLKVGKYAENVLQSFQVGYVDKLNDFMRKWRQQLLMLQQTSLSQGTLWKQRVAAMRHIVLAMRDICKGDDYAVLTRYASACVASIAAVKYSAHLGAYSGQLASFKLKMAPSMRFELAESQFLATLADGYAAHTRILDPEFSFSGQQPFDDLQCACISQHCATYAKLSELAGAVYGIERGLLATYGGALFLSDQKSDSLCAQFCTTYETCKALYEHFMIPTQTPVNELCSRFVELQVLSEEKGIFRFRGVELDLLEGIGTLGRIPRIMQNIAISAAAHLTGQMAHVLIQEVQVFSQKTQQLSSATASSKQLAELKSYIEKAQSKVLGELSGTHAEMQSLRHFLALQSQQNGSVIGLAEMCSQQYMLLRDNMEGVGALIAEKKQYIQSRIQDDTTRLVEGCEKTLRAYGMKLQEGAQFFKQCGEVSSADDVPLLFQHLSGDGSAYQMQKSQFTAVNDQLAALQANIEAANEETHLLFGKQYFDGLNDTQKQAATDLLSIKDTAHEISDLMEALQGIFALIDELADSDWPTLKTRFDIFDSFVQKIGERQEATTKLLQILPSKSQIYKFLAQFQQGLHAFCQLLAKIVETTVATVKMLKTPVLTKQHWLEIIERNEMQAYIKTHAKTAQFMSAFPDSIMGAAVMHFIFSLVVSPNAQESLAGFHKLCREIVIRAENEQSIRGAVDEVQFYLQSEARVQMTLMPISELSTSELTEIGDIKTLPTTAQWKPVLTALSEKKQVLASVSNSPYAKFLASAIQDNSSAIEAITQFALIQTQVGRQLSVLEPVIARKVLVNEHRRFYQAAKVIAAVFVEQEENPLIIGFLRQSIPDTIQLQTISAFDELASYKSVVQQLEAASALLQQVQTALRIYLEEKRLIFPRFYFLADSDVLEVLASATQIPQLINKHVKKMFSAVERLSIDENRILKFQSTEGEVVALRKEVLIEGNPELWLGVLDQEIKLSLKIELLDCLKLRSKIPKSESVCESYASIKGSSPLKLAKQFLGLQDNVESMKEQLDIARFSGEVLTIAFAVQFTAQMDYALAAQNADSQIQLILERLQQYLKAFSEQLYSPTIGQASYGSQEYVMQLKLRQLATDTTHFISVSQHMMTDKAHREWLWNRELKYRVFSQTGDLYLISLDTFLPYTFEYQGLPARLIHTQLTDRCYATLTLALSCAISSNPQGPAGTGKTESVKAYCAKLARPCIVFNCDSAIDREDLSRILVGIVLSGSVGCFDEINRLSPSVLSAVSTDIEDVQQAIYKRSMNQDLDSKFSLSGISVPLAKVSPFSAVFVTMNPASREYRGRSELPFSLLKLLRPCFMGKADTSAIMETILATNGFLHAKMWADKVDLAYALASHRIPKQVHLDWGLRSLQAVLRQAALARAALKDISSANSLVQERSVMIKALADATFSRVQGMSKAIFQQILTDVFGKIEMPASKFGATNELEEKLADKIDANERIGCLAMQLFRALTAKTGVALLGNYAAGKTRVRDVLKKAVFEASNGFIEIREFLISPKAMSRSELLGFVDPQSKEWNEGALTRAARQAVSLLANITKPFIWPLIVFDGDIDPMWIEALNSSLDDNRLLSLSSGERIRFPMSLNPLEAYYSNAKLMNSQGGTNMRMDYKIPTPVSFLFETDSLQHASPATVSRLAVILVADPSLEEQIEIVKNVDPRLCAAVQCLDINERNLPILATQMNMAGVGEQTKGGVYQIGALRTLYNQFKQLDKQRYQSISEKFQHKLSDNDIISPTVQPPQKAPSQQTWAVPLIQSYIAAGSAVLLAGEAQTGKFYCLQQALNQDDSEMILVSCTSLTTREDVMRQLSQACLEYQRGDGQKVMKPKSGCKHAVLFIRNADIVPCDEYGHSQIFSLIWSMVAHQKVYIKGGLDCLLQDISVVVSVQRQELVPDRLKRLMGAVHFAQFLPQDYVFIIPDLAGQYGKLQQQGTLSQWLQEEVSRAEISLSRANQLQLPFNVALPNYLKLVDRIPVSKLIRISQLKLDQQYLLVVMQYLLTAPIPYLEGKKAALKDFAAVGVSTQLYPTLFKNECIKAHLKFLQQGAQLAHNWHIQFVGENERVQQLALCCKELGEFYPCLRGFGQVIGQLAADDRKYLLYNLSAIELAIYLTGGALVYSEADNLSAEAIVLALCAADCEIRFMGADKLTAPIVKSLLDSVARGTTRIAVVIDQHTIAADEQWVQFVAALASQSQQYFSGRVSAADLRGLVSTYQEKAQLPDDMSEPQLQEQFLKLTLRSLIPIVLISPEHKCADTLLMNAPPLRRQYCTVFYELLQSNKEAPAVARAHFHLAGKHTEEALAGITTLIGNNCEQREPPGRFLQITECTKALLIQSFLRQQWEANTQSRKQQLQAGLRQLQSAQEEVDKLAKEAASRKISVEQAQREANSALEEITAKMKIVQDSKQRASVMQTQLQQNELVAKQQYDEASKELSTVQPILEQAAVAVSQIPNDALTEVKSFKNPPPAVAVVLEAVLSFMGQSDVSWGGMRSFLSQNGILRQIAGLDIKNVPSSCLKKVIQITQQHSDCFVQERIYKVSRAAAPLALWVTASLQYAEVYVKVEPLMKKAQAADEALTSLRKQLQETEAAIVQLEKDTEILRENFDRKTKDLVRFKNELATIENRKARGDEMLASLRDERTRWASNEQSATQQLQEIASASICAACMYVCVGNSSDDVREQFCGEKRRFFDGMLANQQFRDAARAGGLRLSDQALENAACIAQLRSQPGIVAFVISHVTDATGALQWLTRETGAQIVSATSENLANLLAIAARFGQSIIVTDCDSGFVPAAAVPYLRHGASCYVKSDQSSEQETSAAFAFVPPQCTLLMQNASGRQAEFNCRFRMFLVSSVSIRLPNDLRSRAVELSFAPTERSRVDFYVDQIMQEWSPHTLKQMQQAAETEAKLRAAMSRVEESLLEALEQSAKAPNILEDENLMRVLRDANAQSQKIRETQQKAEQLKQELEVKRQKAATIAEVIARSMLALESISNLNELYVTDDSSIIPLLVQALRANKNEDFDQKINNKVVKEYLSMLYSRIQTMVFGQDLVGAHALLLRYCSDVFTTHMFQYITGKLEKQAEIKAPTWASAREREFKLLATALGDCVTTCKFQDPAWEAFASQVKLWKEISLKQFPQPAMQLEPLQKVIIIAFFRPDLLSQGFQLVCEEYFYSKSNVEDPVRQALLLTSGLCQPILIYTSSGQDPTNGLPGKIIAISPGREKDADTAMLRMLEDAGRDLGSGKKSLIIVKGAHLCPGWLAVLPSRLQEYSTSLCAKYDSSLASAVRVVLVLEARAGFPRNLSRIGWRVHLASHGSARTSFVQLLGQIGVPTSGSASGAYLALSYALAALHVVLEARREFAPRGVANDPGWSAQDLLALCEALKRIADAGSGAEALVNRARGLVLDAVYGVATRDECDLQLVRALSNAVLTPEFCKLISSAPTQQVRTQEETEQYYSQNAQISQAIQRLPFIKYVLPPLSLAYDSANAVVSLQTYVQQTFPQTASADVLALPANALVSRGEKDSLVFKSILQRAGVQQRQAAQSGFYTQAQQLCNYFDSIFAELTRLPTQSSQPGQNISPLAEELQHQIASIQKIARVIKTDLDVVRFAANNPLLASPQAKQIATYINNNITPEHWTKDFQAPPTSVAPLDSPDLVLLRQGSPMEFLQLLPKALQACSASVSGKLELAFVPRPPALLEAVRRQLAAEKHVELDQIELYGQVNAKSTVFIDKEQLMLQGAMLKESGKLDYQQNNCVIGAIGIMAGPKRSGIPLYVDKDRTLRMPVLESLASGGDDNGVIIAGAYLHLFGR